MDRKRLNCVESLRLADSAFDKPGRIDLILGSDVFWSIMDSGKVMRESGLPVAINSSFGWIGVSMDVDIDKPLRKFWEVEEINKPKPLTFDEQNAIDFFQTTHLRDETGRFTVRLPFGSNKPALGEPLSAATQRLKAMERKFTRDPTFKRMYCEFMAEYQNLDHRESIPPAEVNKLPEEVFYFPHYALVTSLGSSSKQYGKRACGIGPPPGQTTYHLKAATSLRENNRLQSIHSSLAVAVRAAP
ncbi:uncharacterized protein LOC128735797 [Sabethes cyaneus]|uniref:uncharacterized protein LOC128735797 n=1 Tax=Sabethes cyaneus TaxID=53552 RepID=UPI00237E451E|nr:uncharacterized protein LOC128735797 [Sabethes cyaneus]